jgi:hypothetical protein
VDWLEYFLGSHAGEGSDLNFAKADGMVQELSWHWLMERLILVKLFEQNLLIRADLYLLAETDQQLRLLTVPSLTRFAQDLASWVRHCSVMGILEYSGVE